jgi:ribosome-binding protein aMBF1 (putative translation factor)
MTLDYVKMEESYSHMYSHQDWEPVIIRSSRKKTTEPMMQNKEGTKQFRRLCEDDIPSLAQITREQSIALLDARNSKKLTQQELAKKMNIDASIIQQYENGKVKHFNKKMYNTIMRNLGIKV